MRLERNSNRQLTDLKPECQEYKDESSRQLFFNTLLFDSTHVINVSFSLSHPSIYFLMTFVFMAYSITVRQTRNHLAPDVQYISSKKIILPDPLVCRFASLSNLGFGDPGQKFIVCSFLSSLDMEYYRLFTEGYGLSPGHMDHQICH